MSQQAADVVHKHPVTPVSEDNDIAPEDNGLLVCIVCRVPVYRVYTLLACAECISCCSLVALLLLR